MAINIIVHDFLNYSISGLTEVEVKKIQHITGVREKGCFMMASYKSGQWDGRSAYINDDGVGLVRNLPRVLDAMDQISTVEMHLMEYVDYREPKLLNLLLVDKDWLKKETGYALYDYQVEGINNAINMTRSDTGEGGILKLATNAGKCQPLYSKVMTPNGWTTMGELEVGDYVIGSDGARKKVLAVYDGGVKDVYEVNTTLGRKMRSCLDHLYPVSCDNVDSVLPLSEIIDTVGTKEWVIKHSCVPIEQDFDTIGDRMEELLHELKRGHNTGTITVVPHNDITEAEKLTDLIGGLGGLAKTVGSYVFIIHLEVPECGINIISPYKDVIELVTFVGKEQTKCIMIDSDDHLYITDDWLLTHNTVVTLGISKAFDGILKTLIIVPSTNLVEQTYKDYKNSDLRSAMLLSKMTKAKRLETIKNNNHIIMTNSLFLTTHEAFQSEEWVLIYDEVHEFGEKTSLAIRESLGHCQYRVGLTATMPADKKDLYKDGFIRHHFGDDLAVIEQDELIRRGISSTIKIECIIIQSPLDKMSHADIAWEWDTELKYYNTNAIRFEAIIEEIKKECSGNTLVLCQPTLGHAASEELGVHFVDQGVPTDIRSKWYDEFDKSTDYTLFASFGCASTGISINNIQTLILVEVGKDRSRVMQSIGRGLRLDGDTNFIRVVDISSDSKYASQHRRARHKIYNEEGFEFEIVRRVVAE